MQQTYRLLLLALFFNHTSFCMHQFTIKTVDNKYISCPRDTFSLLDNMNSCEHNLDLQKIEVHNPHIQLTFDLLTKLITPPNPPLEEQAKNISTTELNILVHTTDYLQPKDFPFVHLCENVKKRNDFNTLPQEIQKITNQTIHPLIIDNHAIANNTLQIQNTEFNSLLNFCSILAALEYSNLTAIHITNVPLEHIAPADIAGLWNLPLQELKINNTKIRILKTGTFKPKKCDFKLLDLSNNKQLTTIEDGAITPFNNGEIRLINCPQLTQDSKNILHDNLNNNPDIKILYHDARALALKIPFASLHPFIQNNSLLLCGALTAFLSITSWEIASNATVIAFFSNSNIFISAPLGLLFALFNMQPLSSTLIFALFAQGAQRVSNWYNHSRQLKPYLFTRFKTPKLEL